MKIKFIIYILSIILDILLVAITSRYSIWATKLIKILYNMFMILIFVIVIYSLAFICIFFIKRKIISYNYKIFKYFIKIFHNSNNILYIAITIVSQLLINYNDYKYSAYIDYCPFTLTSDLYSNTSSYIETRRCDLYNIYNNSRYKYQYICSYNPYDALKSEKTNDGMQKMQCVSKKHDPQENLKLINEFTQTYKKINVSQLYYCNRVDIPIKDEFIPEKFCNEKTLNKIIYNLFRILNIIVIIFKDLYLDIEEYCLTIILNELLNVAQNLLGEADNCSTDNDEPNSNDESFIEEDDVYMIVENNSIKQLDMDIANLNENDKKEKKD